ncbi:MAG TPA: hypothetical protein VII15_04075, partial [Candidatus Cryosericum sp.]
RIRTEGIPDGLPFSHDAASLATVGVWNLTCKFGELPTVHRRRMHPDQHLVILWNRFLYLLEFKNIGRTVSRAHDCPHYWIPSA